MTDVPLRQALICWNDGPGGAVAVLRHDEWTGRSLPYDNDVGASFTAWRNGRPEYRKRQLMVEAWHLAAFRGLPARCVHDALLVIPEYRDMLADDCLPLAYHGERWGQ